MAKTTHGNAGECVKIGVAIFVIQPNPFTMRECHRKASIGIHQRVRHVSISLRSKNRKGGSEASEPPVVLRFLYSKGGKLQKLA